jgi:uncharacterized protein Yka (UPF0111/DUF47 family)
MTTKLAKRVARLERELDHLRAHVREDIHHGARVAAKQAIKEHESESRHDLAIVAVGARR